MKTIHIQQVKDILSKEDSIIFAYLFGSYAKNTYHDRSDIDVAIYINPKEDIYEKKLELYYKLQKLSKTKVDLIILNQVKNYHLLDDILSNHILLKDSEDDKRVLFELRKEHEIKDFKSFQEMIYAS